MPARHHILAIVAFWLLTCAWLFQRDLWPRLASHEPPPTIDLADEAQGRPARWTVHFENRRAGYALTGVKYHEEDDTFTVWGLFKLWTKKDLRGQADRVVDSRCRLTREGDVRAISADITVSVFGVEAHGLIEGKVERGLFAPHAEFTGPMGKITRDLKPVTVARRGSVLNPLLPVNRLMGLRPGQRWRLPMLDPLGEALLASVKGQAPDARFLEAQVLPSTQELDWELHRPPTVCLVVEYTGDDIFGRTWVREIDGLVLLQEMTQAGESIALRRDP